MRATRPDRSARERSFMALVWAPVLAAAVAGCTSVLPQTPSAIFDLTAPGGVSAQRGSLQVLVPQPTALQALDNNRIAARPSPSQYAYIPGAVWSDNLPRLLQVRLIQTLQNSGRVRAAALPGQGLLIDYQLVMDIRAFEFAEGRAVAEFAVKLMDDKNGRVMKSKIVRYAVPVAAADPANIVAALDAAMDRSFSDIASWAFART